MRKREILGREYILFSQILTEQKIVRKFRLETFKKFLKEGKIDDITPVFLIPIETPDYFGYRLLDGNHRCKSSYDIGQPGLWAFVAKPYPEEQANIKTGHTIDKLEVVDEVIGEDLKYCTWTNSFYK